MIMRDKLYKTNRRVTFYRVRSLLIGLLIVAGLTAAVTIPYPYVARAVNEAQARKAQVETETSEEFLISDVTSETPALA